MHKHLHTHRRVRTLRPMKRHCIVELIQRKGMSCTYTSTHTQRRARTLRPMNRHCIVELVQRKDRSCTYTSTHTGEYVHSGL